MIDHWDHELLPADAQTLLRNAAQLHDRDARARAIVEVTRALIKKHPELYRGDAKSVAPWVSSMERWTSNLETGNDNG